MAPLIRWKALAEVSEIRVDEPSGVDRQVEAPQIQARKPCSTESIAVRFCRVGLKDFATEVDRGQEVKAGETLDGEGGFTVYGKLMPASDSLAVGGLPLGLAHGVRLKRRVAAGQAVRWSDVGIDARNPAVAFRREMEKLFAGAR
mgnify:CR=1 FL=1